MERPPACPKPRSSSAAFSGDSPQSCASCREAGLAAPGFPQSGGQFVQTVGRVDLRGTTEVAPEVTTEVDLLRALKGDMSRRELQKALGLKNDEHFRKAILIPAIEKGFVEMTIPATPNSRLQKYRRTARGE